MSAVSRLLLLVLAVSTALVLASESTRKTFAGKVGGKLAAAPSQAAGGVTKGAAQKISEILSRQQAYLACECMNEQRECSPHLCTESSPGETTIIGPKRTYPDGDGSVDGVGRVRAVAVADIDGDGSQDVVACGRTESRIFIFLNRRGDGSDFELVLLEQDHEQDTCRYLDLRDLDGDGDIDIAFASQETNKLAWFENPLNGPHDATWVQHVITQEATKVAGFLIADVNNDGLNDWLGASFCPGNCSITCNESKTMGFISKLVGMATKMGDDGEEPDPEPELNPDGQTGHNAFHAWIAGKACDSDECDTVYDHHIISAGDIGAFHLTLFPDPNGGVPSILGAYREKEGATGGVLQFKHVTGSTWQRTVIYDGGEYGLNGPDYVHVVDVDLDGENDIIAVSRERDGLVWLSRQGPGEQWKAHDIVYGGVDGPKHVDVGDFDGDGDLDITACGFFDDSFYWFENPTIQTSLATEEAGGGRDIGWTRYVINRCGWGPSVTTTADLDGNGKLDIIGASMDDGHIRWWNNIQALQEPSIQRRIKEQKKPNKIVDDEMAHKKGVAAWMAIQ